MKLSQIWLVPLQTFQNVDLVTYYSILDQNLSTVPDVSSGSIKLTATELTDAELLSHPTRLDPAPAEMIRFLMLAEMCLL